MSKVANVIKLASTAVATTATLLAVIRDNPQLQAGVEAALKRVKEATDQERPRLRLAAKLEAINAAAQAVEELDPGSPAPATWRHQAGALRVRGDLAWHATSGRARRRTMKQLSEETGDLLAQVNQHLAALQGMQIRQAIEQPPTPA